MYRFPSFKFFSFLVLTVLSLSNQIYADQKSDDAKQKAAEQELSKKIHEKIGSGFDFDQVNVEVNKNVVTLTGTVKTTQDKEAVEKEARSVSGVKELKNELKINTNKGK